MFGKTSYNELLGIGISEVLLNLISCHVFMKKTKETVILLCHYCLVNYNLSKRFVILEHNFNHLSGVPNEVKQIIHAIHIQKYIFLWHVTQKFPL